MNTYVPPSIGEVSAKNIGNGLEMKQIVEEKKTENEEALWNEMHNEQSKHSKVYMIIRLIGSAAIVMALANMIFSATLIVVAASLCSLISAPVIMKQRQLILQHCSTRYYIHRMKLDAKRIALHNEVLTETVTNLEQQAAKVQSIEKKLQATLSSQGSNLDQLLSLIEENRKTLQYIKNIQMGEVMTSIFTTVLRVDRDDDFQISPIELKEALFRLRSTDLNICTETVKTLFLSRPKQNVTNLVKCVHESLETVTDTIQ